MGYREKINVYVPHEIGTKLAYDAKLFEILKKDRRSINRNRFLSMLLCGYYDDYLAENKRILDQIVDILQNSSILPEEQGIIARKIRDDVFLPDIPKRKGKRPICLSLKPTGETERIIGDIEKQLVGVDYVSQYFCRMLTSYCQKPIFERERIVFKRSYDLLQTACRDSISVTFSVIWDESHRHEVMPYALSIGPEEIFNYLLCEEINPNTGLPETRSYRLNRIEHLGYGRRTTPITPEIREKCDRSISIAPQYAINSDEEICVRLSDAGEKLYNRIYYGRPDYDRIQDSINAHYYYFHCSPEQAFHYFRRFDNATALIVKPESLRNKMLAFHKNAQMAYEKQTEEDDEGV